MIRITQAMRDAFVNLDADAHDPIAVAEAIALLGRFYLDTMRSAHPDLFYGIGEEQDQLHDLQSIVLAFEALARGHRELFVEEFGGRDGFLAWAREVDE